MTPPRWAQTANSAALWLAFVAFVLIGLLNTAPARSAVKNGRLAFTSHYDIWVMRPDGTGVKPIVHTPRSSDHSPAWAPDGRKIAFVGYDYRRRIEHLYVVNADGTHIRTLLKEKKPVGFPGPFYAAPAWSPNGREIVFRRGEDIYLLRLATGRLRRLARGSGPSWSPNGRQLAYLCNADPSSIACVMDADGRNARPIWWSEQVFTPLQAQKINWCTTDTIVFDSIASSVPHPEPAVNVWSAKPDGTALEQLTPTGGYDSTCSPDGKRIVFTTLSQITSVMQLDGSGKRTISRNGGSEWDWGPAPRRRTRAKRK